jgi:hypothetical protein
VAFLLFDRYGTGWSSVEPVVNAGFISIFNCLKKERIFHNAGLLIEMRYNPGAY